MTDTNQQSAYLNKTQTPSPICASPITTSNFVPISNINELNIASTALPFESSIKFSSNNVSKQQQRKSESEINKVINLSSNSTTGNLLTTSTSNHAYNNVATENKIAKPQFFNNGNGSHQNFSNSVQNAKTTFTFSPILPIKSKSKVFFLNPSPKVNY